MGTPSSIIERFNVAQSGPPNAPTLLLLHGLGCDQTLWHPVLPYLTEYHVVVMDHWGSGRSRIDESEVAAHASLAGYADDVLAVCNALALSDVILVGHSFSSMVALLAARQQPDRFRHLVMICASACYLNDPPHYAGGYSEEDLTGLMTLMEQNYSEWASAVSSVAMGEQAAASYREDLRERFLDNNRGRLRQLAEMVFSVTIGSDWPTAGYPQACCKPKPTRWCRCRRRAIWPITCPTADLRCWLARGITRR